MNVIKYYIFYIDQCSRTFYLLVILAGGFHICKVFPYIFIHVGNYLIALLPFYSLFLRNKNVVTFFVLMSYQEEKLQTTGLLQEKNFTYVNEDER